MAFRTLAVAAVVILGLPGCGSEAPSTSQNQDATAFSGTYRVSGRTVEKKSGKGRDIEGTVVILAAEDGYKASFELSTLFPTPDGPTEAQVVGTGSGQLQGDALRGTADTQIILAQVPGVSPDFAFLPRTYGPRITSQSVTTLNPDGSLTIEIESKGAPGEKGYQGTRTSVTGVRIDAARAGEPAPPSEAAPDAAAGPPEGLEGAVP